MPLWRLLGLVLPGLAGIGLIVGGLWWWQSQVQRPNGELVSAPDGDYKVAPEPEKGRLDGDGTAAVAAAEGVTKAGTVDTSRAPERPTPLPAAPATGPAAAPAPATKGATPAPAAPARATPAATPPARAAASGGGMVQLGAFASEATAARAWDSLKSRFDWLAPVNRNIVTANVGGRTVYRPRSSRNQQRGARSVQSSARCWRELHRPSLIGADAMGDRG